MKRKVLQAIAETRLREADLEALCTDAPPDPSGRWRPQDHLSHLAWHRERAASVIDALRTGGQVPPEGEDDVNTAIYEATRAQSASAAIASARHSWDLIASAIEACSEEDLERPHPYQKGRKIVDDSPGNHVGAHLMWCYLEAGDERAAEAVQLWARDLSNRTFDDARSRAVAAYNLACFYARAGQSAEALPLLREGFEGSPALKEWALKDPDLDPIRGDAELVELLAT